MCGGKPVGTSDIDMNQLKFDLTLFKSLQFLEVGKLMKVWYMFLRKVTFDITENRGVKFPQNLLTLVVCFFHLDAKNEEKNKKILKISLALP